MRPMQKLIRELLVKLGEDPKRPGLRATPERMADSLRFLTEGYTVDVKQLAEGAVFEDDYDEIIILKDIELFSLCEHHLLPFYGKCHVAYMPKGRVIGLSKIPRVVDMYARRLQIQERLTTQIADALMESLNPKGVFVVVEAEHFCMTMRGVRKPGARTVTSVVRGIFRKNPATRAEAMSLIRSGS